MIDTKTTGTTDKRKRFKFVFWLDIAKPEELDLAIALEERTKERQMKPTIKKALQLLLDLEQGNTEVLHRMFPGLATTPASTDFNELFAMLDKIANNQPSQAPRTKLSPTVADDLPELEIKQASSDENASYNMMLSGLGMGICRLEDLPSEIIEYGISKGRLSEDARQVLDQRAPQNVREPKNDIKALLGADVTFQAPSFEDIELDF